MKPHYACRSVGIVDYPDGHYENGHWGGWGSWIGDGEWENRKIFKVTEGVRTFDCPVEIDVIAGYAYLIVKN